MKNFLVVLIARIIAAILAIGVLISQWIECRLIKKHSKETVEEFLGRY